MTHSIDLTRHCLSRQWGWEDRALKFWIQTRIPNKILTGTPLKLYDFQRLIWTNIFDPCTLLFQLLPTITLDMSSLLGLKDFFYLKVVAENVLVSSREPVNVRSVDPYSGINSYFEYGTSKQLDNDENNIAWNSLYCMQLSKHSSNLWSLYGQ